MTDRPAAATDPTRATVADAWAFFWGRVAPPDAGPVQVTDSRRCFYAGFAAALDVCLMMGDRDVPEDAGADTLDRLYQECLAFGRRVREGTA